MDRESRSKSAAPMVTASAKKRSGPKGMFRRIEIEPADNGFTVMAHAAPDESEKYMYSEPTKMVFGDADAAHEHIGTMMGVSAGASKNAKSGKMKAADTKDMGKDDKED